MSAIQVTDGGLETDLIFHHGLDLPEFAAYPLLAETAGRELLVDYYEQYAEIAARAGAGLVLETPTWRANRDWGARLGDDQAALDTANRASVQLLRDLGQTWSDRLASWTVSGCLGPRGDGYRSDGAVDPDEAAAYHRPQIAALAAAGSDRVTVLTLTDVGEAIGISRAGRDVGVETLVGFTVEVDGRLPDGTSLAAAVAAVDAACPPASYVVNCAHPHHILAGFGEDAAPAASTWRQRIRGLRVNASQQSHAELDEAEVLDDGDPRQLAADQAVLLDLLPAVEMIGGCCGTDARHVAAMFGVDTA